MQHYRILDGSRVKDRPALHAELQTVLELPGYYGRNLDALYDCLTDISEETMLLIIDSEKISSLGEYAERFYKTLSDAAEENPKFNYRLY